MEFSTVYRLACALAIGLVIGLQRENIYRSEYEAHSAGIRTFSITGVLGALAVLMSMQMESPAPFFGLLIVLGIVLGAMHVSSIPQNRTGITTSVALMTVYVLGGLCQYGKILESVGVAVCVLGLLTLKDPLHKFAHKVSRDDIVAILKFALISAVILPILPEKAYGPPGLEVLSPYKIWIFVCLISGISFIGYFLIKWIGPGKGIGVTGFLGGLASSLALTLNLSERSKQNPEYSTTLTAGIVISWAVMYLRIYLICVLFFPTLAGKLAIALVVPSIPGFFYAFYLYRRNNRLHPVQMANFTNPFELWPSIQFGIIFTVVLFIANAAQKYFGSDALYISSFVTGLANSEAITLSVLDMTKQGSVLLNSAIKAVAIAGFANTLSKGVLTCILGNSEMRKWIIPAVGLICAVSFPLIFWVL